MALRTLTKTRHGLNSRSIRQGAILPSRLHRLLDNGQYACEVLNYQPRATVGSGAAGAPAYSAPTGATGNVNLLHLRKSVWAYHILGAGQTLLAPTIDSSADGLLAGLDAVASEGVEYVLGGMNTAKNPYAHVAGAASSPNKLVRLTLRAGTVANLAELAVGWRKAETFQALIDNYDEMFCLNVQAGDVKRESIFNNEATITSDTGINAADATDFSIEVRVLGRDVKAYVNNAEVPVGARYQFAANEVVVPFVHFLQGGGGGSTLHIVDYEVGPLYAIDEDPARDEAA